MQPPLPQNDVVKAAEPEAILAPRVQRQKSAGGGTYEFVTDDLGLESFDIVQDTLLVDKSNISKEKPMKAANSNGFFKVTKNPGKSDFSVAPTNDFVMEDLDETDMYDFQ